MGIGLGAIGGGLTQAIGQGLSSGYDKRQMKYQSQLQMRQNRQLSDLAFKQWNRTNYGAQVEHMKSAGLNVGLMSGGGGQAGQSTTPTQSVSRGEPNNFMGIGLAGASLQSQIDVNKAQADKTKAEADSIRGVEGTKGAAEIAKLIEETGTERERNALVKVQKLVEDEKVKLTSQQTKTDEAKMTKLQNETNTEVFRTQIAKYEADLNKLGIQKDDNKIFRYLSRLANEFGWSAKELVEHLKKKM